MRLNRKRGEIWRRYREAAGLTQQEFAEKLGFKSKAQVCQIEKGFNTTLDRAVKASKILGCKPGVLIDGEDEEALQISV